MTIDWSSVKMKLALEGFYLFGGRRSDGTASDELYVLEIGVSPLRWIKPVTSGPAPSARFDHTMERMRDYLVVMGGRSETRFLSSCYVLNLERLMWVRIKLAGHEVIKRAEHSCALSRNLNKFFIFGGISEDHKFESNV